MILILIIVFSLIRVCFVLAMAADQDKRDQPATKQGTRRTTEAGEEEI